MFVKPANLGSSIGISRADTVAELRPAIELAQSYDEYLVFEESIRGREIEVAVLGDRSPEASLPERSFAMARSTDSRRNI